VLQPAKAKASSETSAIRERFMVMEW